MIACSTVFCLKVFRHFLTFPRNSKFLVNIIVNSKYFKEKYSYPNICYICDKFFIQLVYFWA